MFLGGIDSYLGAALGGQIGLNLRASLYQNILARFDRATGVALNAHTTF